MVHLKELPDDIINIVSEYTLEDYIFYKTKKRCNNVKKIKYKCEHCGNIYKPPKWKKSVLSKINYLSYACENFDCLVYWCKNYEEYKKKAKIV